jgi:hypothetical protein
MGSETAGPDIVDFRSPCPETDEEISAAALDYVKPATTLVSSGLERRFFVAPVDRVC